MKKITILFFTVSIISSALALTCKVNDHLGSPTLLVNGSPTVPLMFLGYASTMDSDSNFVSQATHAKKAGIHIYTFGVPFIWKSSDKENTYSYSTLFNVISNKNPYVELDKILDNVISFDTNALIIPRFSIYPPVDWLGENPDVSIVFSDGQTDRVSIASTKWFNYLKPSLEGFIKHCEKKYGEHIIGYHPALLETGEFFYERSWGKVFSGFEEVLRKKFAAWSSNKYHTVKNLRDAWKNDKADFDSITLPTVNQRANSNNGFFRDPVNDKYIIDFYEYKSIIIADTIDAVAEIIKKQTDRNKICVFFYGYLFELANVPFGPQITGHLALKKLLNSRNIDVICSPISYSNRRPGGIGAFMCPVDSIRAAGKLWINEDDTRTYLCTNPSQKLLATLKSLRENLWVYNNHFGHIFPRRMGTWYMDLLNEKWLDSPGIWTHIAKLNKIYKKQLNIKTVWKPEVSVFIDERSPYYLACNKKLTAPLYSDLRSQIYRMGTPVNYYLLSDIIDGTVKPTKVNIFLGAWYLEKSEREKLITALKGKTAIWFYGAGYMNKTGSSKDNISKLTGFSFKELHNRKPQIKFLKKKGWNDKLENKTFSPFLFGGTDITNVFQTHYQEFDNGYKIIWAVEKQKNILPLGIFCDSSIALAKKKFAGFTSVYCGIPGLPAQFLRNVLKKSDVHIYVDSDSVVEATDSFLAICSPETRTEKIYLPPDKYLRNIFSGEKSFPVNGIIKDKFQCGETKLYWIKKK